MRTQLILLSALLTLSACSREARTSSPSFAHEPVQIDSPYPNLLVAHDSVSSPPATLADVSWIAGHWVGEAFGGQTEEIWSPPAGGSMMCAFRLIAEGKTQFYEIEQISEEGGSLILRLKHFHADLKGWEEKDETVDFRLLRVSPYKVFFDGMTFERISETEMDVYVLIEEEGKAEEVKFAYRLRTEA